MTHKKARPPGTLDAEGVRKILAILEQVAPPTQLLSIAEVAARLSCSRGHVYRLIAAGALRTVEIKVEGIRPKSRVREADLEAFIDARSRDA